MASFPAPKHLIMAWDIISSAAGPLVSLGAGSESKMTWAQGLIHILGGKKRGAGEPKSEGGGVNTPRTSKPPFCPKNCPLPQGVCASVSPVGQYHGGGGGIGVCTPHTGGGPQHVCPPAAESILMVSLLP